MGRPKLEGKIQAFKQLKQAKTVINDILITVNQGHKHVLSDPLRSNFIPNQLLINTLPLIRIAE